MNLIVRVSGTDDYISINNLVKEVHTLHVENRPDIYLEVETPLDKNRFYESLNDNTIKIFVVEDLDKNEVIAYSIIQIMETKNIHLLVKRKFIYIDDFCVKSDYQKSGIGKLLFNFIVDYAKSEGVSSIQLTVSEFNKSAIKFYERSGMSTRNRKMELNL